jgi:hypothetical protein
MPETSVDYENVLIVSHTADTPPEAHGDYEPVVFQSPSPTSKVIRRQQHFQKKGRTFRRAIASYAAGAQGDEQDNRTGTHSSQ